ncbi:MAG: hypothetical protein CMJ81_17160 [Planctomycetaceae bacterium]|nr:hypothetical protein [Planctomycetaceae bacterium]MBP62158.1 hypothetical protein [Planctomycetaceae bacterium]
MTAEEENRSRACRGRFVETRGAWIIFQSPSLSHQLDKSVETRFPFEFWLSLLSLGLNSPQIVKQLSRCVGNREGVQCNT